MAETDAEERTLELLHLTMIHGVGPQTCRALLERFGSAGKALDASRTELAAVAGVGPKLAERISRARHEVDAAVELSLCVRHGVQRRRTGRAGAIPTAC